MPTITPEKQQLIGSAVMRQCDVIDGLEDGILNNPLECEFNVESLACEGEVSDTCLSEQEVAAAKTIYEDFYVDGKRVFPGYPVGAELYPGGWTRWLTGGRLSAAFWMAHWLLTTPLTSKRLGPRASFQTLLDRLMYSSCRTLSQATC